MAKEHFSRYRAWILDYFEKHADERVSAAELYHRMKKEGMHVSLTTVYRNLEKLTEEGRLAGQQMRDEEEQYYFYMRQDLACASHLHLYCEKCGRLIHLNCGFMDEISGHLMKEHGFAIDCGQSILTGICEDCRRKERNTEK